MLTNSCTTTMEYKFKAVACHICHREILEESVFCPYCGWLNSTVDVEEESLCFPKSAKAEGLIENIKVKYIGKTPIKTTFIISENNLITFENDEHEYSVEIDNAEYKLPIKINATESHETTYRFILNIESEDGYESGIRTDVIYGKRIRKHEPKMFIISFEDPKELQFDRELIVFDEKNKTAKISVFNPNTREVEIVGIQCEANVELAEVFYKISGGDSGTIELCCLEDDFSTTNFCDADITYKIVNTILSNPLHFYITGKKDEDDESLPYNIIAIDFGTSKTTGAYVNYEDFINGEYKIEDLDVINSQMSYEEKECRIGNNADEKTQLFARSMKTHLCNETIKFKHKKRGTIDAFEKDINTVKAVTDFLLNFKSKYLNHLMQTPDGFPARNKYIFTLPVRDDSKGDGGILYKKQMEATLMCAKAAFNNDYYIEDDSCTIDDDIDTIKESEAAMFSIIDIIEKHDRGWKSINLKSHDVICIFDFGAGTLDITFGEYFINDKRKPDIKKITDIGRYGNSDLGGDIIDSTMFENFCHEFSIEFDESLKVKSDCDYYTEVHKDDLSKNFRQIKETLSKNWENIDDSQSMIVDVEGYNFESVPFKKDMLNDILEEKITAAIVEMKNVISTKKLNLKYIFLVGGSSLFVKIREMLRAEFKYPDVKVYSPYDYVREDCNYNDSSAKLLDFDEINYNKVKESAVHAVARGAVLSYLINLNNLLNFDIEIRSLDNKTKNFNFKKYDILPIQRQPDARKFTVGTYFYNVIALIDGNEYSLGTVSFDTRNLQQKKAMIYIRAGISKERKIYLEYSFNRNPKDYNLMGEVEVYV